MYTQTYVHAYTCTYRSTYMHHTINTRTQLHKRNKQNKILELDLVIKHSRSESAWLVCPTDGSQLLSPGLCPPSSHTHPTLLVTSLQREELNIICSVLSEVGIIRNYLSVLRFFTPLFIIHVSTGRDKLAGNREPMWLSVSPQLLKHCWASGVGQHRAGK